MSACAGWMSDGCESVYASAGLMSDSCVEGMAVEVSLSVLVG